MWTYGELERHANAWGQRLLQHSLDPEEVVGVLSAKTFGYVAAILGVLLAGKKLLLLDPVLPNERRDIMLREAGAGSIISDRAECEPQTSLHFFRAEEFGRTPEVRPVPFPEVQPDQPACIFFTSGSLGTPKGILVPHKGISHFIEWQRRTFGIGPDDRCAQLTAPSFDVVLRDLFLPLTACGTICLPDNSVDGTASKLLRWLDRSNVTAIHTVPTLMALWLEDAPDDVQLGALRWLFSAGEPLTEDLVRRWRTTFPSSGRIVNLYGPTETVLAKASFNVPSPPCPGVQPIGSPISNTQIAILRGNQMCGAGELGEIVIRTPFRSYGYIGRYTEYPESFTPNPFRPEPSDLVYRTGDQGRFRADGTLEILGRYDRQIKVRGIRISPGEIETLLQQHPSVSRCAITADEDRRGETSLVAHVVVRPNMVISETELHSFLAAKSHCSVVPSKFIFLDTIPTNPNGKLDIKALRTLAGIAPQSKRNVCVPDEPIFQVLCGVWMEILDRDEVDPHDNFFEHGGNSLEVLRFLAWIKVAFQCEISPRRFLDAPTVVGVVKALQETTQDLASLDTNAQLLLSFAQTTDSELAATAEHNPPGCTPQ